MNKIINLKKYKKWIKFNQKKYIFRICCFNA